MKKRLEKFVASFLVAKAAVIMSSPRKRRRDMVKSVRTARQQAEK